MFLKDISIINYKNIKEADITLSPKINCFIGNNGEGKTNFLDAVYYLSFCHSAYNPIDSQIISHGSDFFVIEGEYVNDSGDGEHVYCGMKLGSKKHVRRNKKEYKRLSQHIGLIPLIFIAPTDISIIEGGSDERRRLMDMVISQYDNTYIDALTKYNKALQQRNALLRQEGEPDVTLMSLWEEEMANYGEVVYHKRDMFAKEMIPLFQEIYETIVQSKETVSVNYVSHCQRGALLDVIQRDRAKDRAVGYSLHGIHRDDLEMLIDGYQLKREGSQGQEKTFMLVLKLAQFNFLSRASSNTLPLLLLDDIFDKLDVGRVEQIVRLVSSDGFGQILITDTNRAHLDEILHLCALDYKLFTVKSGEITETEDK